MWWWWWWWCSNNNKSVPLLWPWTAAQEKRNKRGRKVLWMAEKDSTTFWHHFFQISRPTISFLSGEWESITSIFFFFLTWTNKLSVELVLGFISLHAIAIAISIPITITIVAVYTHFLTLSLLFSKILILRFASTIPLNFGIHVNAKLLVFQLLLHSLIL